MTDGTLCHCWAAVCWLTALQSAGPTPSLSRTCLRVEYDCVLCTLVRYLDCSSHHRCSLHARTETRSIRGRFERFARILGFGCSVTRHHRYQPRRLIVRSNGGRLPLRGHFVFCFELLRNALELELAIWRTRATDVPRPTTPDLGTVHRVVAAAPRWTYGSAAHHQRPTCYRSITAP